MTQESDLDPLTLAILHWGRSHPGQTDLWFEWSDFKLLGTFSDVLWPDDTAEGESGWVVYVRDIDGESGRRVNGVQPTIGRPIEVSLLDPPERVTDSDGHVVWSQG